MLFTDTQPTTAYWKAPKLATGINKTLLAITGKNADGSNNTWGEIGSWIPGINIAQNAAASKVAGSAGLADVQQTINSDLDNRIQKLTAGLGVGEAVAGALTGNPAMVVGGLGSTASGIFGAPGMDTADQQAKRLRDKSRMQYFEHGGIKRGEVFYDKNDHREDLLLIDPKKGTLEGAMRYNEGILSQSTTAKVEALVERGDAQAIGKLLIAEIKGNPGWSGERTVYAGGGKPDPKAKTRSSADWMNAFLPPTVDTNPLPSLSKSATQLVDPLSGERALAGGVKAAPSASTTTGMSAKKNSMDWLGTLFDVTKAGIAAVGANQALPQRERNPELARMEAVLKDKAQFGLSTADRLDALRAQGQAYARDINTITSVAGGGDAAAVLAAVGAAGSRADASSRALQATDRAVRDNNQLQYYRALLGAQGEQDNLLAQATNNTIASRDAYGKAMAANLQSAADRQQFNSQYGPGSAFADLMTATKNRRVNDQAYAVNPMLNLFSTNP